MAGWRSRPSGATREEERVYAEAGRSPSSPSPSPFSCSSSAASMSSRRPPRRRICFLSTSWRKSSRSVGSARRIRHALAARCGQSRGRAALKRERCPSSARIEPPPPNPIPIVFACSYGAGSIPCRQRLPRLQPLPARILKLLGVAASAGEAEDIEVEWRDAAGGRTAAVGMSCAA